MYLSTWTDEQLTVVGRIPLPFFVAWAWRHGRYVTLRCFAGCVPSKNVLAIYLYGYAAHSASSLSTSLLTFCCLWRVAVAAAVRPGWLRPRRHAHVAKTFSAKRYVRAASFTYAVSQREAKMWQDRGVSGWKGQRHSNPSLIPRHYHSNK